MSTRVGISKSKRFAVFSRDGFACKYCGRQSDEVTLHVDHVTPVCQGGTNDIENLITSCVDCNLGKGGKTPTQAAPTESDRLRLAQERNEQARAFEAVKAARAARESIRQEIVNFWCGCTGREEMDIRTLATILGYVEQFGIDRLFQWIEKAAGGRCGYNDKQMGMYISGIRRMVMKEDAAQEDHEA